MIEMFTFVYFLKNEDVMSLILLMFSVPVVFESPMSQQTIRDRIFPISYCLLRHLEFASDNVVDFIKI